MQDWLNRHWVAAAGRMAIVLTAILPMLVIRQDRSWLLVYAMLPAYMLHQLEEHTGDRFRQFVNQKIFGGVQALTPAAILWINLPGVWGVGMIAICAAWFAGVGWGLPLVYLVLVNGISHILAGGIRREYNPGLWTSLVLFIPLGTVALIAVNRQPEVSRVHDAIGLFIALAIHGVILAHTRHRAATLKRNA